MFVGDKYSKKTKIKYDPVVQYNINNMIHNELDTGHESHYAKGNFNKTLLK